MCIILFILANYSQLFLKMDRKVLNLIVGENLLKNLKKNAHQNNTSLEKYIEKILKEFINAK